MRQATKTVKQSKQKAAARHCPVCRWLIGPAWLCLEENSSFNQLCHGLEVPYFPILWNSLSTVFQKEEPALPFSSNLLVARGSGRGRDRMRGWKPS